MAASWRYLQPGPHEKSVSRTICSFSYCWFGEWVWEYSWCLCAIKSDVILCFSFYLVFPAPAQWKQHFFPVGLFRVQGKLGREYVHPAFDRKQEKNVCWRVISFWGCFFSMLLKLPGTWKKYHWHSRRCEHGNPTTSNKFNWKAAFWVATSACFPRE